MKKVVQEITEGLEEIESKASKAPSGLIKTIAKFKFLLFVLAVGFALYYWLFRIDDKHKVPNIFVYLNWAAVVVLFWKFVLNIDSIVLFLVDLVK